LKAKTNRHRHPARASNSSAAEKKNCSPAMEASNAAAGGASHIPIYISDEDDDVETQEAILLSICSSRAASASTSSPRTDVSTVGETPPGRKGKLKLQSEGKLPES
jgi:hypothetical protein